MRLMAIDPGLLGAWCVVDSEHPEKLLAVGGMPTVKHPSGRGRAIHKEGIVKVVVDNSPDMIALEQQFVISGQGLKSAFTTGYGMGLLDMMVSTLCIPATVITAQEWTKHMLAGSTGDGKERAVSVARALYPNEPHLCKSNGRADAICIARYILAKNSGSLRTRIADSRA